MADKLAPPKTSHMNKAQKKDPIPMSELDKEFDKIGNEVDEADAPEAVQEEVGALGGGDGHQQGGKVTRASKDLRSFRPGSVQEWDAMRGYRPLVISYTGKDGSHKECGIGCGNSLEDLLLIHSCILTLWSFIIGFYALLMKGAIDTSNSNTLLWTFFFLFLFFVSILIAAVYTGQIEKVEQDRIAKEEEREEHEKQLAGII